MINENVAIIIPYRRREDQLKVLMNTLHPLLYRQNIRYRIFVIQQQSGIFNRALLLNVGYQESLEFASYDCFIFHDVDLLPEDYRNLYTCHPMPRHMSVAVDKFDYKLPYKKIVGGVFAISKLHFECVLLV